MEALRLLGEPLAAADAARIAALSEQRTVSSCVELESILDRYTLMNLALDSQGVGKAIRGGAGLQLLEFGWRSFLVKVENPGRLKGPLMPISRLGIPEGDLALSIHDSHILGSDTGEIVRAPPDLETDFEADGSQWMGFRFGVDAVPGLEGKPLEYQILQLYSQSGGSRAAPLSARLASIPPVRAVECKGFIGEFLCSPASTVALAIHDWDGAGATASLVIHDEAGRLYPTPAHRLEPDLGYQPQIYRADGESLRLAAGKYQILATRGAEYLECRRDLIVPLGGTPTSIALRLERWINPPRLGWYPGDPHLHPEGQAFGAVSKLGLTPETLLRQVRGEALTVGSVLIWTGGYYYEKQFLTGHVYQATDQLPFPEVQKAANISWTPRPTPHDAESLLRYDAEQAAFPSNRWGHAILLRLKNHDYPGGRGVYDWPSWNLPVFQWARAQDAISGYAHCGNGMQVNSTELPNYEIPALEGLGANECFVDITHGAVDFIACGEVEPAVELNIWYHLLNCGFAVPMIGETDFPVGARGRRMGVVRTYVGLDERPIGDEGYNGWTEGIKAGRVYFGDGRSHLIDLRANGHRLGNGPLELSKPGQVTLTAQVAARLEETPVDPTGDPQNHSYAYWHLERSRIGVSRKVSLEVIVNGRVVERRDVLADGQLRPMTVEIDVQRSSWIALRIMTSSHTAPIVVSIGVQPVRASRRSAQWCLDCIEALWSKHAWRLRESERADAAAAWSHARETYHRIMSECESP